MIIILLILFAILTFATWMLIEKKTWRLLAGVLSFALLSLTVVAMTLSFTHHLGMQKETQTKQTQIYSAGDTHSPAGLLLAQEIGSHSGNYVLIYRDQPQATKASVHFKPDQKHITEAVLKKASYRQANVSRASVKSSTTRWVWKNDFYRLLFGIGGQGNELVKEKSVVTIPSDTWVVASPQQAKQLAQAQSKMNPAARASQQAQSQQAVQIKVAQYQKAHPQAKEAELKAVAQHETAVLTAKAMKTSLAKIK